MMDLGELAGFLRYPRCGSSSLLVEVDRVRCGGCGAAYRVVDEVPDLRAGVYSYGAGLWRVLYDLYAPFYDALEHRLALKAGFAEDLLRVEIAGVMELRRGNVVLEVRAGTCRNLALFARLAEGIYIGVDVSLKMLSKCADNVRGARVGLVLGYAENLPFRDGVFDRVLVGGCLGHVSDKGRVLREASRVLKSGGVLVVYDQGTCLDRVLGRDRAALRCKPGELSLLIYRHLFGGHIYVAKFVKSAAGRGEAFSD